jgi:hypothetical protein
MSNPQIKHKDGTYQPLATMSIKEWDDLRRAPMSDWAARIGKNQITVNSMACVVLRRQKGARHTPYFGFGLDKPKTQNVRQ